MYINIKKAALGKIILERENQLPEVYDNLTQLITDLFFEKIKNEFTGNQMEMIVEITFNPPKSV